MLSQAIVDCLGHGLYNKTVFVVAHLRYLWYQMHLFSSQLFRPDVQSNKGSLLSGKRSW